MCGCKGNKGGGAAAPVPQYIGGPIGAAAAPMGGNMACGDNLVLVRYEGPVGRHLVYSPLKKFANYGMHTKGDILCVHFDDQKSAPKIFVVVEEAEPDPQPTVAPTIAEAEVEMQIEPEALDEVAEPKPRAKSKKSNGGIL